MKIEADVVSLSNKTGSLVATGHIHFSDGDNRMSADRMEMDINTKLGVLYKGRLFIKAENYYMSGEKMERYDEHLYAFEEASFTACDCPEAPDWHIRARRMRLRVDQDIVARDVVFYVNQVPLFYSPYFKYPTHRQTGLLMPRLGYSSRQGLKIHQPLFWAISPHQDATFAWDHRGSQGNGIESEYRYVLSRETRGNLDANYFYDEEKRLGRWDIRYNHQQRLSSQTLAKLDLRYINERNNFLELSEQLAERSQQYIESNFFVSFRGNDLFAYLLTRYTLNLTTPNNNTTFQKLPEIGLSLIEHRMGKTPLFLNVDSTAVNFWRTQGGTTQRIDYYPKITWPMALYRSVTLTPSIGFRETWYHPDNGPILRREIVPTGIELSGRFATSSRGWAYVTTPTLLYDYIHRSGHTDIPSFDDLDTLQGRNSATLFFTQRLFHLNPSGERVERLYLRLTESLRVRKMPSAPENQPAHSDLRGEWKLTPSPLYSMSGDSFYNAQDHRMALWNTDVQINLPSYVTLSVGQRYNRAGLISKKGDLFNPSYLGDVETAARLWFWTGRLVIKTPWGVDLATRSYFDADLKKPVEMAYGLRFQSQCWGVILTYLDLQDRNELAFSIDLTGIGGPSSRKMTSLF